ncbi:hypothetical protein JG688_00014768 [Phytophthora aleatoria]|uniref:Uncharacterized protein n=1 Tax=Phytophthora aleatoria TaxID=2496075 RepID=A0A8J5IFF2_9STRA|nr:hypothetical protein JG688_00014768 [Phytophthora aleatoria]
MTLSETGAVNAWEVIGVLTSFTILTKLIKWRSWLLSREICYTVLSSSLLFRRRFLPPRGSIVSQRLIEILGRHYRTMMSPHLLSWRRL